MPDVEGKNTVNLFFFTLKVTFGQDGGKGRLVVDGLRTREGRLPENYTISLRAPVYLGLAPSGKPKVNRNSSEP